MQIPAVKDNRKHMNQSPLLLAYVICIIVKQKQ